MSIFQINADFRITRDQYSWQIEERHTPTKGKQAGEEQWIARWWYPNLDTALKYILERIAATEAEGESLRDLQAALRRSHEAIEAAVARREAA